jgi:hypothetical protein
MTFFTNRFKILSFTILIFGIGILLRHYQLNFESFWFDEIISFWEADPTINLKESLIRAKNLDGGTSLLFNIILKYFFYIFGYSPEIGRYLPFIFGILSIPLFSYLSYLYFPSKTNFLLIIFLTSFNWYLISYSQEMRLYSLHFLLSIASLIFFKKICDESDRVKNLTNAFFYILITSLGIINHIFFLIIIFSKLFFISLNFLNYKKNNFFLLFNVLASVSVYLLVMFKYLITTIEQSTLSWISQVNLSFFINFYFSRLFGSNIMGLIFLITLIFLIIKFKEEIFYKLNDFSLMFILLIFSYIIPLIYSLIFSPILTDRYISFVLIPILIMISIFTTKIDNKFLFYSIITLISVSSIFNTYLEVFKRDYSKPEFKKAINIVLESDIKNIYIKENLYVEQIKHYLQSININVNNEIKFLVDDDEAILKKNFWFFCYKPLHNFDCSIKKLSKNLEIGEKKDLKHLQIISYNIVN